MPTATPTGQNLDLYALLRRLPQLNPPNEVTFLTYALPKLAAVLGYDESEVRFQYSLPGSPLMVADAVFVPSGWKRPHAIIEVKRFSRESEQELVIGKAQVIAYVAGPKRKLVCY